MALYIGANYHPHDWDEERWKTDIAMMKDAGFTTVRIGHLCWDMFEPEEGVYNFSLYDKVMDMFAEAGIGVVLDVPARPAPVWVHKLCPGCNIGSPSGNYSNPVRRYMDDVADPGYRYYALRFARKLVRHYKNHPALFAWGVCNEQGSGFFSLSEESRKRFSVWLRKKYKTVDALNMAWSAHRWSRKLRSFDDAVFPVTESCALGAPEPWLDMRRFFSDNTSEFLIMLKDIIEEEAPGTLYSSNHYAEHTKVGFDYLGMCDEFGGYPGMGFYPDYELNDISFLMQGLYMQRLAETGSPMWFLEFRSGNGNGWNMYGPKGAIRCMGMLCLLLRAQMILGWTWRSMYAGEEKFIFGLLTHDGEKSPNYYEYERLASDMKKLEPYGFPYLPVPEIAVSYDYPSFWITEYHKDMFKKPYLKMQGDIARVFWYSNREYNVVDLKKLKNDYKLIIVPDQNIMDEKSAEAIREYVMNGGAVIMTGTSAFMDENSKVFRTLRPGRLEDVFGIRIAGFRRTDDKFSFGENAVTFEKNGTVHEKVTVRRGGSSVVPGAEYYDIIELRGAECFAGFDGRDGCAVSCNVYGSGRAYYTAAEADTEMLMWLINELEAELGLTPPLNVPQGVQAREIAPGQFFYVNYSPDTVEISLAAAGRGVLSGAALADKLILGPYDAELVI